MCRGLREYMDYTLNPEDSGMLPGGDDTLEMLLCGRRKGGRAFRAARRDYKGTEAQH